MDEQLTTVFLESIAQAFFPPFSPHITFEALYWFGQAGLPEALALIVGAEIGGMFNWLSGLLLAIARQRYAPGFGGKRFARAEAFMQQYGLWMLPFYWIIFGSLLPVAAGLFRLRGWQVAAMLLMGTLLRIYLDFPTLLTGSI